MQLTKFRYRLNDNKNKFYIQFVYKKKSDIGGNMYVKMIKFGLKNCGSVNVNQPKFKSSVLKKMHIWNIRISYLVLFLIIYLAI